MINKQVQQMYSEYDPLNWNDEFDVLNAVRENGLFLKKANSKLRDKKEIVKAAIENEPLAIMFAEPNLRNDIELALIAVNKNFLSYRYLGLDAQFHTDVVNAVYPTFREHFHMPLEEKSDWLKTLKSHFLLETDKLEASETK